MKKIITASLVAMMAVTAAHADIASTDFVTSRTGTVSFDSGAAQGKTNLTEAIKAVDAALGATTGNAATKSELQDAQNTLQANIDKKVDLTVYNAHLTAQSGVDSDQNADIEALQNSIADGGATDAAIKAAAAAAAAAQQTADGAVNVNTQQGEAITALQNTVNDLDGTYATDAQATAAAKAATDALNAGSVGAEGSFISTVSQTEGTVAAGTTAFVAEINDATQTSTIAPQTAAVKAYVDTQFGVVNDANSEVAQKVVALESAVTAEGALIDQFSDHKDEFDAYKTSNDAALAAEVQNRTAADTALDGRVDALEGFRDGLGTEATVDATANNVVTSVTTKDGKVTAVGSAQITNAMVAETAAIEKSKLHSDVQTSLGLADEAVQRTQVGIASDFVIDPKCIADGVVCSLVVRGNGANAIASWEVVAK